MPLTMREALRRGMFRLAASRGVRVGAVLAAAAVVLGLGVLGLGHGGPSETNMDTRYLYLAGKYWLAGTSAYTPAVALHGVAAAGDALQQYNFAYPPQTAPLCLVLATGSMARAFLIMNLLNLAAIALLGWIGVRTVEEAGVHAAVPPVATAQRWFVPALVAGNLSTAFVVWMGQTTLIVAAALAAAWYWARHDRPLLAGAALAVATFKPPLSLFAVLWFVLTRQWRIVLAMAGTVLLFAAVPMVIVGPVEVFVDWLHAIGRYGTHPYNTLGSRMLFNLRSLFHAVGMDTPDLFVVGFVATLALWHYRRVFSERDLLGCLIGMALLFGYSHSYDLAALVVLIPVFWRHLRTRAPASLVALGLLFVISFPNSLLVGFDSELLLHARVVFAAGALIWLLVLSAAEAHPAGNPTMRPAEAPQGGGAADARCFPSTSRMP